MNKIEYSTNKTKTRDKKIYFQIPLNLLPKEGDCLIVTVKGEAEKVGEIPPLLGNRLLLNRHKFHWKDQQGYWFELRNVFNIAKQSKKPSSSTSLSILQKPPKNRLIRSE